MTQIAPGVLRRHAIAASLFPAEGLKDAIERLGFVQCDPIRAPARAQDLILRQRVSGYREGDLERSYASLGLEEDFLYAYGVVPGTTWRLLHPRPAKKMTKSEERVWELVCAQTQMHPRELEPHLGRKREINAWGGYSKATTRTLDALHYRGLLRIAGRDKGIRLFQAARPQEEPKDPAERLRALALLMARILSPVPVRSLRAALRFLRHSAPSLKGRLTIVGELTEDGSLSAAEADGVRYVWPSGDLIDTAAPERVRFLAPFDPLVWDRYRFEHLWGWPYRFEAYTPPAKRKMGYYALPLLWGERVIGWVNAAQSGAKLAVSAGFVERKPSGTAFRREFEAEVERLKVFLLGETG